MLKALGSIPAEQNKHPIKLHNTEAVIYVMMPKPAWIQFLLQLCHSCVVSDE